MSGSLKKIAFNALAVSGGEVANKASTFLVYAMLSRLAGLEAFGQLSIGLTLLYTCHVFGYAGLPTTLIRLVAKRPATARRQMIHGYLAVVATSSVAAITMVGVAFAMQYQVTTTLVVCLLAAAVPFYSLTLVAEAIIKGRERMSLIAMGNVPGNAIMVLGSFVALWSGLGVLGVAAVIVASRILTFLMLNHFAHQVTHPRRRSKEPIVHRQKLSLRYSLQLLSQSRVFLGSDGIAAIGASLFSLILSKFASEREVGMLSASFQLMQPIQILYRSFGHSSFPPLVAAARNGRVAIAELSSKVLGLIVRLAFPACLIMFALSADVLNLVYGHKGFSDGALVLQILAFTLLCDPLNPILGHGLWAAGEDRAVFRIVATNICINLTLGLILIGAWGLTGAAVCALISSLINTAQHYWLFARRVGSPHLMGEIARLSPAIAGATSLMLLSPGNRFVILPAALILYALIALAINLTLSSTPRPLTTQTSTEKV